MKSWKTTVAGVVAGLAILFAQANNYLDADAATVVSYEQVMLALGMLGIGWFAKDKNTTGIQQ